MQTVPSLVGSGTAVAAAALGLAFAQPDGDSNSQRALSTRRRTDADSHAPSNHSRLSSAPVSSRPGTSCAATSPFGDETSYFSSVPHRNPPPAASTAHRHAQRPASAHFTPPKTHSRRQSLVRQGESASQHVADGSRDSISSNGSWMRRLSLRPLSQHGSLRSSAGPETQSIAFSHGSSAPILSPSGTAPPPLTPNKLVKRAPSAHQNGAVMRRRAKSHLPTLRRPATSHQRSATLHQNQLDFDSGESSELPKFSFDHSLLLHEGLPQMPEEAGQVPPVNGSRWTSLFHSRRVNVHIRGTQDRLLERGTPPVSKRIRAVADDGSSVYLVKGELVEPSSPPQMLTLPDDEPRLRSPDPEETAKIEDSAPEEAPTKRARRSVSLQFASPANLLSKAGSIRRSKRGAETKLEGRRYISAPIPSSQEDSRRPFVATATATTTPEAQLQASRGPQRAPGLDASTAFQPSQVRQRNSSSPLPPLSRLSSFNVDLPRLGASGTAQTPRSNQPSGSSQSSAAMASFRNARHERSSTLTSSDMEIRGFNSGDDDDTDFRSDTLFDSIRTGASGRNRAPESPVESMFDESPPSTAGNNRTKRLSIQEILGRNWDADDRIMEEDESIPTPVRDTYASRAVANAEDGSVAGNGLVRPSVDLSSSNKDTSRISLDDDFDDDDWARDEDELDFGNKLSPPSSMNSRGVSPNLRFALASTNGNEMADVAGDLRGERPRSNIFDWAESVQDNQDAEAQCRPRTVHGKRELDLRGGRSSNRRGPAVAHVRSQSVPVVHDPSDTAKAATQKYGTWGLGTKGASEDWDDDFEFGAPDSGEGSNADRNFDMVVPASIQASQPSLRQHTGQIRELSMLVNDLKRLCRHGRDLEMLSGPHAGLWTEAEGIIALASPDENELEGMDVESSDFDFEASTLSDKLTNDELDVGPFKGLEDSRDPHELRLAKTTVIRERPSGRRRSVFSPDDDIFGGNKSANGTAHAVSSRPKTPENNINLGGHDVTDIVKSVLDAMQHRSTPEVSEAPGTPDTKLHFGTNNLKALVKRAGDLRDALSDLVRRADQITQSPARTPRRGERDSPAFVRVFTPEPPPSSSPPKRLPHGQNPSSALSHSSHEASPSSALGRRMQMMTVS